MMLAAYPSPEFYRTMTLKEREALYEDQYGHHTAFSPRPETSLAVRKQPPMTDTKISVRHKVRTPVEDTTVIYPLPNYQVWVDAGSLEPQPVIPHNPDYNSNIWRNFSKNQGFHHEAKGRAVSALVASMYPVPIPPPSQMGKYTYDRFIKYGDIMKSDESKMKKIMTTKRELEEMKRLNVLSEARVPPTDDRGRIAAPLALRRLRAQGRIKYHPMDINEINDVKGRNRGQLGGPVSAPASFTSKSTSLRRKGLLWKFSYKLNNPVYDKVVTEQRDVQRWRENNAKMRRIRHSNIAQQFITHY